MDKYFRTEQGERVNVIEHCREILGKYPKAEILIGTDSQSSKSHSYYSTVIVFRYGNNGAHYIYNNTKIPKIRDVFKRLFKECEMSIEIAEYISEHTSYKIAAIELDYAGVKITKSTPLVSSTKGWCEALGYRAIVKGGEMIACKAADHCCRKNKQ